MSNPSRRDVLFGAALGAGGVALGAGGVALGVGSAAHRSPKVGIVDCHGPHQAGIATPPQGFLSLTAYDLVEGADAPGVGRLMRLWTEDIERLTTGTATITDTEPELAQFPASLTITVGFGPSMFDKLGLTARKPSWLRQLPPYSIDQLDEAFVGGDIVVQVCSDDPITTTHAARVLAKEATSYARPRWTQHGSRNAPGITTGTMRNHFGQLDGTRNPDPAVEPGIVFRSDTGWLDGGSTMVVRRIHMNLDSWDELDVPARDIVLGRRQSTGAPLTGEREFDEPDLTAKNSIGFPVIDVAAHIRRARTEDGSQRIVRRPYNYVDQPRAGEISNIGLIFIAFQADLDHQFLPLQAQLAELDLLNQWTTPVGSAVFAIPGGFAPGEILASELFATKPE